MMLLSSELRHQQPEQPEHNAIPVISNDEVDQTVRLKPNETAALAGFLETQLNNAITGNPGISEIPGAGLLDQNQNAQQQETELLILVTPRMVRLARRNDHTIYAGQGSTEAEGGGAVGDTFVPPPPQVPEPGPAQPTQLPQAGGPPRDRGICLRAERAVLLRSFEHDHGLIGARNDGLGDGDQLPLLAEDA